MRIHSSRVHDLTLSSRNFFMQVRNVWWPAVKSGQVTVNDTNGRTNQLSQ